MEERTLREQLERKLPVDLGWHKAESCIYSLVGWNILLALRALRSLHRGKEEKFAEYAQLKDMAKSSPEWLRGFQLHHVHRIYRKGITQKMLDETLLALFPSRYCGTEDGCSVLRWSNKRYLQVRFGGYPLYAKGFIAKAPKGGITPLPELFDTFPHIVWTGANCLVRVRPHPVS